MKVLILNGSPRKQGTVATLLKAVAEGAAGHEIEWVDIYDLRMHYCNGCMKCRPDGECILPEDDAHTVGRKIKVADALVIGTPTYWANMSSQLKVLLERNVPVFMGVGNNGFPVSRKPGRPAVIVTSCNTPWPFNILAGETPGVERTVKEVLNHGGYKVLGKVVKPGVRKNPQIAPRLIEKARRLGQKI